MLCVIRATRKLMLMVLRATRKLMVWYLEQQENLCFVLRATRKSMLKVIRGTRKSMPHFQGSKVNGNLGFELNFPTKHEKNNDATLINTLIGSIFLREKKNFMPRYL